MGIDLRKEVFVPVLARMKKRAESLGNMKRFRNSGIEGWFKVEIVAVLGEKVRSLQNKGPDLVIEDGTKDGTEVELKAATNFGRTWMILDPIRKFGTPCLFLGDGTGRRGFKASAKDDFEVVGSEVFRDGLGGDWIIGLAKPRQHANEPDAAAARGPAL